MPESEKNRVSDQCWKEWISKKAVANAGVVVINFKKQVLVLFKPKNQEWEIPSGAIDKDEEPDDAAVRELREETHISLSREQLTQLGVVTACHPKPKYPEDKTDVIVTFMANSNGRVVLGDEGHTMFQWLSREEIDKTTIPMHPMTRIQIRMAYEKIQ